MGGVILRRRGTRDMMGGASRLKTTLIVMWPINHFLQVHNVNSRMSNANSNVRIVFLTCLIVNELTTVVISRVQLLQHDTGS